MPGWLDDLEARAAQSASSATNNVTDWLSGAVSDAVIKVGDRALGNQTALEIAQGQKGGPAPVAPGQGLSASQNARPYPTVNVAGMALSLPMLIGVGLAAYLVFKKSR